MNTRRCQMALDGERQGEISRDDVDRAHLVAVEVMRWEGANHMPLPKTVSAA